MTTYGDGISAALSNTMQNIVEETYCPKCQKGKLRATYLNVDLDLVWLCSKCLYPLEESNLHDYIISANTAAVLPQQMRKRKRSIECESVELMPTETTSHIYNNYNITQAELEDINTCSQLNKKARLNDTSETPAWCDSDRQMTRVNHVLDSHALADDTAVLERGEVMSFDLRDVT